VRCLGCFQRRARFLPFIIGLGGPKNSR
jgi:hypothetical protein